MENKENDLLLTMISNPTFSLGDLKNVGLSTNNTSLASKDTYQNLKEVQDIFKRQDGSFNQESFDQFYNVATAFYNNLANDRYAEESKTIFDKYDMFAPQEEEKNISPNIDIVTTFNPDRQRIGTINLWRTEDPTLSREEIAQSQKVLLNPVNSEKGQEQIWGDRADEHFFRDFFKTRVLATYDNDGTHIDPISGQEVEHKKGDYKLNNQGTYFYEELDGRNIYGKQVLNKLNVITKEGTKINKYDVFDSDDLDQKSATKTLLKNIALVGSMWIPYVGPAIAAASIGSQLVGIGAILGKMVVGSDNPTLSAMEGWSKSVNRQGARSQYAQENTWCWENFINTIGDVMGQLKEQRFIFEKAPALFKGGKGLNPEAYEKELLEKEANALNITIRDLQAKSKAEAFTKIEELTALAREKANLKFMNYMKDYNNIGRIISQSYMTAITVQDSYGELKLNGATDLEAMITTLGYAAGEYGIINSELGRWILPELKADSYKHKAIIQAAIKDIKAASNAAETATKEGRQNLLKKLFNIGRNIWRAEGVTGVKTLGSTVAAGLAEGTEEVSEELLQDFVYSCFNGVRWLRGQEQIMSPWENMADRYAMSFVGGLVGGAGTNIVTDYKNIKSYDGMTRQQALQEMAYMVRNGQIGDFYKTLNKVELGRKDLSAKTQTSDGVWAPGTKEDNQDLELKNAIRQQVDIISQILDANGLKMSDDSFLSKQIDGLNMNDVIKDFKLTQLTNTATAGRFLQDFNSLAVKIITLTDEINRLQAESKNDKNETVDESKAQVLSQRRSELAKAIEEKEALLQGKRSPEFIRDTIVELSPVLQLKAGTFHMFAEHKTKQKYEDIPEDTIKQLSQEYEKYQNSELKDDIHLEAEMLEDFLHQLSGVLTEHSAFFQAIENNEMTKKLKDAILRINAVAQPDIHTDVQTLLNDIINESEAHPTNLISTILEVAGLDNGFVQTFRESITNVVSEAQKQQKEAEDTYNQVINSINQRIESLNKGILEDSEGLTEDQKKLKIQEELAKATEELKQQEDSYDTLKTQSQEQLNQVLEEKQNVFRADLINAFLGSVDAILGSLSANQNYLNKDLKDDIVNALSVIREHLFELGDTGIEGENDFEEELDKIDIAISEIESRYTYTPIEEFLGKFALQITGEKYDINKVIDEINRILQTSKNGQGLQQFAIDNELELAIDQGLKLLSLYSTALEASRTDNGDINKLFGFSLVLNKANSRTEGYQPLAEIDGQTTNALLQDVEFLRNKLEYAQLLFSINQGQKFLQQDKIALNKNYILYNQLTAFAKALSLEPADWEKLDDFVNALENCKVLKENASSQKLNLSEEQIIKAEEEIIKLEDAINDFFQANIFKEGLSPEERMARLRKLLSVKNINYYSGDNELLTDKANTMDPDTFVWYLASRAAIRSSNFYGSFRTIINDKVSPISTQVMAIYTNVAAITNIKLFNEFQKAINQNIYDDWQTKDEQERANILAKLHKDPSMADDKYKELVLNFGFTPNFRNIILTEGIPGSGKTRAVMYYTNELLKKYNPKALDKVFVVSVANETDENTSDAATDLATKGLDLKNYRVFSHKGLLKQILNNYTPFVKDDVTGKYKIDESDYKFDPETNELNTTLQLNESEDTPSIIYIDEISRYNYYELKAIDNYAQKHNIVIIAAGDFDQSGAIGRHKLKYKDLDSDFTIELSKRQFINSQKLGFSMRSLSSQMTNAINALQAFIQNPKGDLPTFRYVENPGNNWFYGVKVLNAFNPEGGKFSESGLASIEASLDIMIKNLGEGEKIGYVYNVHDELYDLLQQDKYKDKIKFYPGNSAQSFEGKYYIVNIERNNLNEDHISDFNKSLKVSQEEATKFVHDLYTAVSRAQYGVLMIHGEQAGGQTLEDMYGLRGLGAVTSEPDSYPVLETYGEEAVISYSKKRKAMYDGFDFLKEGLDTTKMSSEPSKSKQEKTPSNDFLPKQQQQANIDNANNSQGISPTQTQEQEEDEDDPGRFNSLLYSFNTTSDYGYEVGDDGKLQRKHTEQKYQSIYEQRRDGINGLIKLKPDITFDEAQRIISLIQKAVINRHSGADLVRILSSVLKIDQGNLQYETGFKSRVPVDPSGLDRNFQKVYKGYEMYQYFVDEENIYNQSTGDKNATRAGETNRKQFVIRIGDASGNVLLEVPIFTITNPKTLIYSQKNGQDIYPELKSEWEALGFDMSFHAKVEHMISYLEQKNDPKYKHVLNLFKLFNYTQNNYFVYNGDLLEEAQCLGPEFTSKKGRDYEVGGLFYDPEKDDWNTLSKHDKTKSRVLIRTRILINTDYDGVSIDGNPVAPKGVPFILETDSDTIQEDKDIISLYIQEQEKGVKDRHVKLIQLLPPYASIESYIRNIKERIEDKVGSYSIGNELTSYRLLSLLKENTRFKELLRKETDIDYDKVISEIEELDKKVKNGASQNELISQIRNQKTWTYLSGDKAYQVKQLFDNVLYNLVYPRTLQTVIDSSNKKRRVNKDNLNLIKEVLATNGITEINYDIKLPKDKSTHINVGQFYQVCANEKDTFIRTRPEDDPNATPGQTEGRAEFLIHGKDDPSVYSADITAFVQEILNILQKDSKSNANYTENKLTPKQKTKPQHIKAAQEYIQKVLGEQVDTEDVNELVSRINNSGKAIAIVVDGKIKITDANKTKGLISVLTGPKVIIEDQSGNVGDKMFKVTIGDNVYWILQNNSGYQISQETDSQTEIPEPEFIEGIKQQLIEIFGDTPMITEDIENLQDLNDFMIDAINQKEDSRLDEILKKINQYQDKNDLNSCTGVSLIF